ncbi:MAG: aminopeptidase P family protein [Coriobacteriia bacterium]|nr:aminopeptidase P family protein [Coriobacteriia bacterium]
MSQGRIRSVRTRLADSGADAFVVTDPVNIAYLTGFSGVFDGEDAHAVVVDAESTRIYTDSRYFEVMSGAADGTCWDVIKVRENLYLTLCTDLVASGVGTLTLESSVAYGRFRFISERFGGAVEVVDGWVEEVRQVKEPGEVARIAAAAALADRTFDFILPRLVVGAVERDIALDLEVFMRREGSEGVAFPPIVASGPNSALPHARVTRRAFEAGDFVKLDFGACVDGYCSDMTRTVVVGCASQRQREIYAAVLAANLAGIDAVRPDVPGNVIDAAARALIASHGFGELFGHGLGHGVGREVHELPNVGPRATRSVLCGSVITIEPGVYVEGYGGVRIEDLVVVEDAGARLLSHSTKDLIETG